MDSVRIAIDAIAIIANVVLIAAVIRRWRR